MRLTCRWEFTSTWISYLTIKEDRNNDSTIIIINCTAGTIEISTISLGELTSIGASFPQLSNLIFFSGINASRLVCFEEGLALRERVQDVKIVNLEALRPWGRSEV